MSPYAADHNLLPHLQNISRDGTLHSSVSSCRKKHVPDLLFKTVKQLQHQKEKVQQLFLWIRGLSLALAVSSDTG